MSEVVFVPKEPDWTPEQGWPAECVGDGFINVELKREDPREDSATYIDQFQDTYEFFGQADGEWAADVRED